MPLNCKMILYEDERICITMTKPSYEDYIFRCLYKNLGYALQVNYELSRIALISDIVKKEVTWFQDLTDGEAEAIYKNKTMRL